MQATPRDIVILALVVSLGAVALLIGAVLSGPHSEAGSLMTGLALLAAVYAACAALQVASLRAIAEAGAALSVAAAACALMA